MDENENLTGVGELLAGNIPAVIREVVERSKLGAVRRSSGTGALRIAARDVEIAARGMFEHLKLLEKKPTDTRSEQVKAAETLGETLGGHLISAMRPSAPPSNGAHKPHLPATA